jgi:hypothetical protein
MNTSYRQTDRRLSDVAQQKRITFTLFLVDISANLQLTREGMKRPILIYFVYLSIIVVALRKEKYISAWIYNGSLPCLLDCNRRHSVPLLFERYLLDFSF